MLIVKIEDNNNFRSFEFQNNRNKCWMDGYIEVPKELENKLITSKGYCDLVIDNGILKDIIPHPEYIPEEENLIENTEMDDIRAMLINQEYRITLIELGVNE